MAVSRVALRKANVTSAPQSSRRVTNVVKCEVSSKKSCSAPSDRRSFLAGAVFVLSGVSALALQPSALAEAIVDSGSSSSALPETIYFGNGCFWARQKDFVDVEKSLGRPAEQISSVAGYAGGTKTGPDGKVCYYYNDPRAVYEKLGHAEVVQVKLNPQNAEEEFSSFARRYFQQFSKTKFGMMRLDPQDSGAGYRNVIGIPGGVNSPYYSILKKENGNGMDLREGQGNEFSQDGKSSEGDLVNVVWVVDSTSRPFYRAEKYHQFHNGVGAKYSEDYTQQLKGVVEKNGRIDPTGCAELPFF